MDPMSALSISASAVQFVDFTTKLISRSVEIYRSATGESVEYEELRTITEKLVSISGSLEDSMHQISHEQLQSNEQDLKELCKGCKNVSAELVTALKELQSHGKHKRWSSIEQALKSHLGKDRIAELQRRIDRFREQLVLNILVSFRSHVISEDNRNQQLFLNIGKQFLSHIEDSKRWQADLTREIHRSYLSEQRQSDSAKSFLKWTQSAELDSMNFFQDQLFAKLRFSDMTDRQERIAKSHEQTFEWIFKDPQESTRPWKSFIQWLANDSPLYWITGKPGAGKSTLVKFLFHDLRTQQFLKEWSDPARLILAGFYFWNSGSPMQMSLEGLLRSLLSEALLQCTHLVPRCFPGRWEVYSLFGERDRSQWSWDELRRAFELLIKEGSPNIRFYFFIDGLDEFDGDPTELVDLLHTLASSIHVKFCVSSRPWNVFENAFKDRPSLMLQDLTYLDIQYFTASKLYTNPGFDELRKREEDYAAQLVEKIAQKSSGVFLWVDLVVRSLLAGLTNGDKISDLDRRLEALPRRLEDLFEKILDTLEPGYRENASQLFQIVRAARVPPSLLCLYFADLDDPNYFYDCRVKPLGEEEKHAMAKTMSRRINSRCKGLLEVSPLSKSAKLSHSELLSSSPVDEPPFADLRVEYLHRTVKDYLARKDVWDGIVSQTAGTMFNPHLSLCKSFIIQLKTLDPESLQHQRQQFWEIVAWCIDYAIKVEGDVGYSQIQLLDAINDAASQLAAQPRMNGSNFVHDFWGSKASYEYHWTSVLSKGRTTDTFLTFAVKCKLNSYVQSKLEGIEPKYCSRLLYTAVSDYRVKLMAYEASSCWQRAPSVEMIRMLLQHGADPNIEFYGSTSLQRAAEQSLSSEIINLMQNPSTSLNPITILINESKRRITSVKGLLGQPLGRSRDSVEVNDDLSTAPGISQSTASDTRMEGRAPSRESIGKRKVAFLWELFHKI